MLPIGRWRRLWLLFAWTSVDWHTLRSDQGASLDLVLGNLALLGKFLLESCGLIRRARANKNIEARGFTTSEERSGGLVTGDLIGQSLRTKAQL